MFLDLVFSGILAFQTMARPSQIHPAQMDASWHAICPSDISHSAYLATYGTHVRLPQIRSYGVEIIENGNRLLIRMPKRERNFTLLAKGGTGTFSILFARLTPNFINHTGGNPQYVIEGNGWASINGGMYSGPSAISVTMKEGKFVSVETKKMPNACYQFSDKYYDLPYAQ